MSRNSWGVVFVAACLLSLTNCATESLRSSDWQHSGRIRFLQTSGASQSHTMNGIFGSALVATVTSNGAPVAARW